jgi:membrane protein
MSAAGRHLRALSSTLTQLLLAPGRPLAAWLEQLARLQIVDRGVGLGAQAFTALLPLLIVYSAVVPAADTHSFADNLIARLKLSGATAESVRQAIAPSSTVAHGLTALGLLLLIVSALSLARALQRVYEVAYGLPAAGIRGTPWHLLWIALIPAYLTLRPLVISAGGGWWHLTGSLLLGALGWLLTPYVLLGRRIGWQALVPGAVSAAIGMTGLSLASAVYLPHSMSSSAEQYGTIGVAFAMLSWLVAAGFVLIGSVAAGVVARERLGIGL